MNEEKTNAASNNRMFKRLGQISDQLYEVELAKIEIEHKAPIIAGLFFLQYAKLLELYYNLFTKFCDTNKYEEMETDTNILYLALGEKELYDCIRSEKRQQWELLRSKDCTDSFTADACTNSFPGMCCAKHKKKHDRREPGLFKAEFRCLEMLCCLCSKTDCCYDSLGN